MNRQQRRKTEPLQGMRFQNGYQGTERTPFLLVRPETTAPTRRVGDPFSPAPGVSEHFEGLGLHRMTGAQLMLTPPEAVGWSWTTTGRAFRLLDTKAHLVAAFDLQTAFDRAWHHQTTLRGRLLVYIGDDLVPGDGKPVPVQLTDAQAAGSLVAGTVLRK